MDELKWEQDAFNLLNTSIENLYAIHSFSNKDENEKEKLFEIIRELEKYRLETYKYDIKWNKVEIEEP